MIFFRNRKANSDQKQALLMSEISGFIGLIMCTLAFTDFCVNPITAFVLGMVYLIVCYAGLRMFYEVTKSHITG